jgi:Fe-S cluster assembly ATP-binding protein
LYEIVDGKLTLDGQDITDMDPHERAKLWIFLAFQTIPEIKGIKLFEFLRTIYSAKIWQETSFIAFKKVIEPLLQELSIDKEFLWRDLNVWFSGGERRKIEMLQMRLLEPRYIFLDEVDSWLDVDAFRSVAQLIQTLNKPDNTFIIITHYFSILDYVPVDRVYVLDQWKVAHQWLSELAHRIRDHGFETL